MLSESSYEMGRNKIVAMTDAKLHRYVSIPHDLNNLLVKIILVV